MNQNTRESQAVTVVAICGSLRPTSYTRMALRVALRGAELVGAQTRLLNLSDYDLPFCDGMRNPESLDADVLRLRADVRAAQGIILGTPEYHGGYSGVLKNALDLMGFEEFEGKMLGLIGVGGGALGALNALNGLRTIGRSLHAWVIPEQVSLPNVRQVFDEQGQVRHNDWERRLTELGRQVARFAFLHNSEQALEFLRLWEQAPFNPGGELEISS